MKKLLTIIALAATSSLWAFGPDVSNVTLTQNKGDRTVIVRYTLEEDAIVTIAFYNGQNEIPGTKLRTLVGDVNRKVKAGNRGATWRAGYEFSGEELANVTATVTAWPVSTPPDYMVLDLVVDPVLVNKQVSYYASSNALPYALTDPIYKCDKLVMRKIPAKDVTWRMGSPNVIGNNDPGYRAAEKVHYVTFSRDYYMGIYPVTAGHYRRLTGGTVTDPSDAATYHVPANKIYYNNLRGWSSDNIDWPDTGDTVASGSTIATIRTNTGINSFDLPTEAEWEYACRAGTGTDYNDGSNLTGTWVSSPVPVTGSGPVIVGSKAPNNWGLYDCHGNINEWVLDWYAEYELNSAQSDPKGPKTSETTGLTKRVYRGGYYHTDGTAARSAVRNRKEPTAYDETAGFRLRCYIVE